MKKYLLTVTALLGLMAANAQGNHVFSGNESPVNFGEIDLRTATSWSTDRLPAPGYFGAGPGATYSFYSNSLNIDGYVKEYNNTSFFFPVGTGSALHGIAISGAPATNTIASAWIDGDPGTATDPTDPTGSQQHPVTSLSGDILYVSNVGQWDWQDFVGNTAGTTITVNMPDLSALDPAPAITALRLVGWNGTAWVNLSTSQGSGAASGTLANGTLTGTMQVGITAIAVGSVNSLLPVTIINFTGKQNGAAVLLNWSTASEAGNKGFNVQRSTDGVNFYTIGYVGSLAANGNSTAQLSYSFVDNSPAAGANYYRLNQIDLDGHLSFTKIVKFDFKTAVSINVWPNPAINYIQVSGITAGSRLQIVDMLGQVVLSSVPSSATNKTIDVQRFSKGSYVLQVIAQNGQAQSFKFIKQ